VFSLTPGSIKSPPRILLDEFNVLEVVEQTVGGDEVFSRRNGKDIVVQSRNL
jgi:hypothetical protein